MEKLEVQGGDVDSTNEVAFNHSPNAGRMDDVSLEGIQDLNWKAMRFSIL